MTYTTNNLAQLAERAPTDEQLARLRRGAHKSDSDSRLVSLARYCERRAEFYVKAQQEQLALAYADFAARVRRELHY